MSADHPLAQAASRAHPQTDAVLAAQAQGEALDARVAALADLTEPTDAARDEIRAALAELCRASSSVAGGEDNPFSAWERSSIGAIRDAADRLFAGESWVIDIRASRWRPM